MKTAFMFGAIVLCSTSFCQPNSNNDRIIVKSFSYVWEDHWRGPVNSARVILFKDTACQMAAKKSFISALGKKWAVDVSDFNIEVKKFTGMAYRPKFKTKLKSAEADTRYAFIQIFDKGGSADYSTGAYTTNYEIFFRLIDGKNQSLIVDRIAFFNISRPSPLPGQILLSRLPGHPVHFMRLIDSIADFAVDTEATNVRRFEIPSAYVYDRMQLNRIPKQTINNFPGSYGRVKVEQAGKRKNVGGNSAAGALTLLTGIGTDKVKTVKYKATHSYFDGSDTVHLEMNYTDEQRAERERVNNDDGSKSLSRTDYFTSKIMDKEARNFIMKGTDTLGFYKTNFALSTNWIQMWDGLDSNSVSTLPVQWNNESREMSLEGKINDRDFSLLTMGNGDIWKIVLNGQHVANVYGKEKMEATLFEDLDEPTINTISFLCKVGNHYFRYE